MWVGRGGGGEETNDGVGHRGQSLKFKKARWMNERKNEEVKTECSARELVHTEVAVSIPPPPATAHDPIGWPTHPYTQQYEQQQQQETASVVSFVRKLGAEAGILGKYYCKEI